MIETNITTTIYFYVENHDRVVKFFEEIGFQTFDRQVYEITKVSHMRLSPKSDFRISVMENPEIDSTGSMTMQIADDRDFATHFTTAFTLKEANFIPRAKSDLESNSNV